MAKVPRGLLLLALHTVTVPESVLVTNKDLSGEYSMVVRLAAACAETRFRHQALPAGYSFTHSKLSAFH